MHDQQGARDMYLHTNATQKEIAEKLGLDPKTVYLWIKKGKWDEMKAAARQAPGIIQQQLYNHITAINDSIAERESCVPTFQEIEMLRKLIVSTKHMQQMSLGTYVQAFQEFTSFIGPHTNDLEFSKRVANVADDYIKGLIHNRQFHIAEKVRDTREAIKEINNEFCNPNSQVCHPEATRELTHEPSPQVCHPDNVSDPTHDPRNTSLSFGEGRGEASPAQAKSGIPENEENVANPSPSITSPEISTTQIPDSIVIPNREIEQNITRKDYIKYEYLLETKTEDPTATVDFNGVKANLMTIQYNLKQFEEPEYRRQFLSREDVHKKFSKYGCW